jgi:hypothetical protein
MAVGDIYQLTLKQYIELDNPMLNVFHFEQVSGVGTGEDMCSAFVSQILPYIQALYYSDVKFNMLELRGLFSSQDDYDMPLDLDGTRSGVAYYLPQHDAMAMRMSHANPDIRSGWKRWLMPYEADQDNGELKANVLAFLNTLGNALLLGLQFVPDGAADLVYCIVKRLLVEPGKYRLPENLGEAAWGVVENFEIAPIVSTQNTRKVR